MLDGVAFDIQQSTSLAQSFSNGQASGANTQIQRILDAVQGKDGGQGQSQQEGATEAKVAANGQGASALSGPFLTPAKEDLVEAERELLQQV